MTLEEVREKAPFVFAEQPTNPNLSERYCFVPTVKVLEDLQKLGWTIVNAHQRSSKRKAEPGIKVRSLHMITLRNEDLKIVGTNDDTSYVQILLRNSHDGGSSFRFDIGIFRLVCSNGMVIKDRDFGSFKITHIGYTFEELRERINEMISGLQKTVTLINTMNQITLTPEQQQELALKAFLLRKGIDLSKENKLPELTEETIDNILEVRRAEDKGDSLWIVFNRIQEAVIKGGFKGAIVGKRARKVRPVKNFIRDIKLNQELFELASTYIPS